MPNNQRQRGRAGIGIDDNMYYFLNRFRRKNHSFCDVVEDILNLVKQDESKLNKREKKPKIFTYKNKRAGTMMEIYEKDYYYLQSKKLVGESFFEVLYHITELYKNEIESNLIQINSRGVLINPKENIPN